MTSAQTWAFRISPSAAGTGQRQSPGGLHTNDRGGVAMVSGDEAVRQSLLLLLSTQPGERVMRPGYGCWLQRLLFAPNDAGTAGLAMHYIREAIQRWEPRIAITRLRAGCGVCGPPQPEQLDIELDYRVRDSAAYYRLSVGYDLHQARLLEIGASPAAPQAEFGSGDGA